MQLNLTKLYAQSSNHWTRNFNEESSLLSGAVVGGGAGPAAIFYNPASISEIEESKLSLNASLFSFDFLKASNAWGNDIDFYKSRLIIVPRFISYMSKPKNNPNLRLEFAFLNNENYKSEDVNSVDKLIDILPQSAGDERYNAFYRYYNKYRDDWLGVGGSYKISPDLFVGGSMFLSIRTLNYSYLVDIEAGPPQFFSGEQGESYFTAKFKEQEFLKFNNYRLLWKLGVLYKKEHLSFGLNLSTPSVGVYADGKSVLRRKSQSDISNPQTGQAVPNYLVSDFAEDKNMMAGYKNPLSIAAGITWWNKNKTKVFYSTFEYFAAVDPYKMVEAKENSKMVSGTTTEKLIYNDWLTFVWGAKPVLNAAIGYRWIVKENLMMLGGFRTDFNYRKGFDYKPLLERRVMKGFNIDKYHLNGGLTINVLGQDLMAGLQYTFGYEKDQRQFINLSDPVEYNPENYTALQGVRQQNMNVLLNSISIYFGATINFGEGKDKDKAKSKD
ncbi:MAG: hypothetical protein ABFS16_09435 [Bacteroidota bacterium]